MELYFLSVGYGEAMVALDGEHCLLVDGGPGVDDAAYTQPGTIPAVTFLKEKQVECIDCMICTHVHNDHVSGLLEVARQFPVDTFWCNCLHADSPAAAVRTAQPVCDHDLSMRLFAEGLRHWEALVACLRAQERP
ncbi:MAG: MBL fold metallo-hydrolase [Butyricicoccus pullicaecorum]